MAEVGPWVQKQMLSSCTKYGLIRLCFSRRNQAEEQQSLESCIDSCLLEGLGGSGLGIALTFWACWIAGYCGESWSLLYSVWGQCPCSFTSLDHVFLCCCWAGWCIWSSPALAEKCQQVVLRGSTRACLFSLPLAGKPQRIWEKVSAWSGASWLALGDVQLVLWLELCLYYDVWRRGPLQAHRTCPTSCWSKLKGLKLFGLDCTIRLKKQTNNLSSWKVAKLF